MPDHDDREVQRLRRFARVGWAAKGVLYLALAGVIVGVLTGESGEKADSTGAIRQLADTGGVGVLWLLAAGLLLYAMWQVLDLVFGDHDDDARGVLRRIGRGGSAAIHVGIAAVALRVALSGGSEGSSSGSQQSGDTAQQTSQSLLDSAAGRLTLGVVALVVVGIGLWMLVKGIREEFDDTLDEGAMGPTERNVIGWLGRVGHSARGLAFGLTGASLLLAALTHDRDSAKSLDQLLRGLDGSLLGSTVLTGICAGFAAYGAYCALAARHKELHDRT